MVFLTITKANKNNLTVKHARVIWQIVQMKKKPWDLARADNRNAEMKCS
jgi:hypothetical protein